MIELTLFRLLFILSPSQLTYFSWANWSYIGGQRIDYLALSITFPEILILALLLLSFIKKRSAISKLNFKKHSLSLIIFLLLVATNIFFATNPLLTSIKWARIILYIAFAIYLSSLPKKTLKEIPSLLFLALLWSSILSLMQFFKNSSLDSVFYFLGERRIRPYFTGIATTNFFGREVLRSYATFPHPNVFAGFTLASYLVSRLYKSSLKFTLFLPLVFFLTRSVHILISLLASFIPTKKLSLTLVFSSLLLLSLLVYLVLPKVSFIDAKGIAERVSLFKAGVSAFSVSPLFGSGLGGSLYFSPRGLIQPIHNVFILLLVELGVVGLLLVSFLIRNLKVQKSGLFIAFLALGLFDHYLITLPQGLFISAVVLSLFIEKKH